MTNLAQQPAPLVSADARLRIAQEDIEYKNIRCAQLLDQVSTLYGEKQALMARVAELEAQLAPDPEEGGNG